MDGYSIAYNVRDIIHYFQYRHSTDWVILGAIAILLTIHTALRVTRK